MNNQRASCWSVTINNPTRTDEEQIAIARQKGWKVEGQKEVGESGTPHYQLLVQTGQVRFSAVKKQFPRAHIEEARDRIALQKYVHKEETKVGEMEVENEFYPSQARMWDMFAWWVNDRFEPSSEAIGGLHLTWNQDEWLVHFDLFVSEYIQDGYVLEGIAVNPQVRSGLKKFGLSIFLRSKNRDFGGYIRRQTDRQTDRNIFMDVDIPEDERSEAETETSTRCSEVAPCETQVEDSSDEGSNNSGSED